MATLTKRTPAPSAPVTDTAPAALATGIAAATAATQFANMSEAEIDAAIATAVAGVTAAETAKQSGTKAAGEAVKAASCNLLMLVGRKYQMNPKTTGEDIALMVEGKEKVEKWQAGTKSARFSEYDAIGEAARKVPQRFSPDLFATAGGKDKFITLCRAIVKEPTVTADALKTLADTKTVDTTGDRIAKALRILGEINQKDFAFVADAVEFLNDLREEKEQNGLYTSAELRKRAATTTPAATGERELTIREKLALVKAQRQQTVQ